jgi:hypothetical protein
LNLRLLVPHKMFWAKLFKIFFLNMLHCFYESRVSVETVMIIDWSLASCCSKI